MRHGRYLEHFQGACRPYPVANHAAAAENGAGGWRTRANSGPESAPYLPAHTNIG